MLAYHNDPKIKAKFLCRVRAHRKADEITQGYGYWRDGRGCAVGCTLHVDDNPHARYPDEIGVPKELAYLEDCFFEHLPPNAAKEWPERFLAAIPVGADLSRVYDLWSAWNLIDPEHGVLRLVSDDFPEVRRVVQETADDCLFGKRVNDTKRQGAARAARAAWAARAAFAADAALADRAAEAAWAAEAAEAAEAARAARAARAAFAADAALADRAADVANADWAVQEDAYYSAASEKLIALMESAPVAKEEA